MPRIKTINSYKEEFFYKLRKELIHNKRYEKLRLDSIIAYTLLDDLMGLSYANHWYNEKGEVYVKMERAKLMKVLNIKSEKTYSVIIKDLKKHNLIKVVKNGRVPEIYIYEVEVAFIDELGVEK
ncbi:MAG: replication initiator protein A [Clostridium sp.]